ncbi:TIGR00730 family Rossman fold protein [Kutzneria albida]|uniref:Cytokinin riboside 5'-monophosphate phosphoribohydrolase n=1 Tax=Kutzneria albida DSM 43870 TaxID=1449976 RepID=W5WAY7_9PSEU|nr:TIGR00730 family Rossman fold protein [Kutzneria albida]AHH97666.1 hypothetical protein KALB_4304 [Kutzneria albida DSM 43870]
MGSLSRVAVFVGSSTGNSPTYAQAAEDLGTLLATEGLGLVYGGARVGLMGVVADAALAAGGEVHGVIPQSLVDLEVGHSGLTRLEVVGSMHERKAAMAEAADAFVALPGGAGTLEELFEVWTWQQLGLHGKPVALLDVAGFWQPLVKAVDHMVDTGFIRAGFREALLVVDEVTELLPALRDWHAPDRKWLKTTS